MRRVADWESRRLYPASQIPPRVVVQRHALLHVDALIDLLQAQLQRVAEGSMQQGLRLRGTVRSVVFRLISTS